MSFVQFTFNNGLELGALNVGTGPAPKAQIVGRQTTIILRV